MKLYRLGLVLVAFAFFIQLSSAAVAPSLLTYDPAGITGFELYGNGMYWYSSHGVCGTEFPHDATIKVRPTLGGGIWTLEKDCAIMNGNYDSPVRDDLYGYFFANRQLMRKALNGVATNTPQVLVTTGFNPTLPAGQLGAALTISNNKLYWAQFANNLADVYSMPTDGSEAPKHIVTINGGADVLKMQLIRFTESGTTYDGLVALLGNGKLYRYKFNAAGTLNLLLSGISDFAVHHIFGLFSTSATIYATTGQSGLLPQNPTVGQLFKVDSVTGGWTVIYTAQSNNQLLSVAVDSDDGIFSTGTKNVYVTEGVVTCDLFCSVGDMIIKRHTLPGTTTGWDQIVTSGGGFNLRSDDYRLFFTLTNAIKDISTDAPAQVLDIQADALEVVQVIQDLESSMTLVANRPTYVRGYAHLATNTTGQAQWFPSAKLRGFRQGVEMAGSPIEAINNPAVDKTNDLAVLRSDMTHCFLFQLPDEWVKPEPTVPSITSLTFEMTVNPELDIAETPASPLANNKVTSKPAFLVKKGWPCVVTIPVYTTGPTYYPDNPGFQPNFDRARSLMPIEDFSVFAFAADEPVGDPDEPFDMLHGTKSERADVANDILDAVEDVDLDSDPCDDKPDVHYLGMLHQNAVKTPGVIGDSYRSTPNAWVTMFDDEVSGHAPGGGETMAHEMGHNYGRQHIMCGSFPADQANFDFVPFPNTLGLPTRQGTTSPFGFDTISLTVIPPDTACDTMSYGDTKWCSIWYWSAVIGETAAGPLPELAEAPPVSGRVALVSGNIFVSNNIAVLRPFKILPIEAAPPMKLARSRTETRIAADSTNPVKVAFFDDKGAPLGSVALMSKETSNHDQTRGERIHFGGYVDFPNGARSFRFAQGNTIFAERFISANAPRLQLDTPVIDTTKQTLSLSWTADDPDGDPLRFTVQYSSDNGQHWMALKSNWKPMAVTLSTRLLPGGTQCLLRVTASDGANATMATTSPFAIGEHVPEVNIAGIVEGERIPYGAPRSLRAHVMDAETPLLNISVVWNITGPTSLTSTDNIVMNLQGLAPGAYTAKLTATDAQAQSNSATKHFEVSPLIVPDSSTPTLDGVVNDVGYSKAAFARIPLGNNEYANVRLLHANNSLYVAFSNLKLPAGRVTSRRAGIRIDVTGNPTAAPGANDVGFFVDANGIPSEEVGIGSAMAVTLSPKPGFSAAVHQGATTWSAELRISDDLVGGWNHPASIMLDHDAPHWPPPAIDSAPNTWASAIFGASTIRLVNRSPVANAGPDQRHYIRAPRTLYLDGSASYDPDGDAITYSWRQVSGPAVTLADAATSTPSFLAQPPADPTVLVFELTVTDPTNPPVTDTVQVTLLPALRLPPPQTSDGLATFEPNGDLKLRLVGQPQQMYRIEASEDFVGWTTIRTVSADFSGRIDTTQAVDFGGHRYLFFRAASP